MTEYKMCANEEMAIDILEFIKQNYEKHSDQAGVQKYIEALQMGIDALNNQPTVDAAEVCQCEKCKYYESDGNSKIGICRNPKLKYSFRYTTDFCNYEERSERE